MQGETIRMLSSMATREMLTDLVDLHVQVTGQAVRLESAGGVDVARRVREGESVDVVVLASGAIDGLIDAGRLDRSSRVALARSGIGMAVRAGAPHPDTGCAPALRQAVLAARTLGYSTGPSGTYLAALFERWGIADEIAPRIVQAPPGIPVATLVAQGQVELGFQQLSELIHVPGIDVLGPLPDEIQSITVFCAAVATGCDRPQSARALLDFLASPDATPSIRAQGMEPA